MKYSTALLTFLIASGSVMADSPSQKTDASADVAMSESANQTNSRVSPDVDPVTVTSNRPGALDRARGLANFPSAAPRDLSTPLAFDVVSQPVLVTVRTGNTEELRKNRVKFPFENIQDSTVRNSDVFKIRLAKFKLD